MFLTMPIRRPLLEARDKNQFLITITHRCLDLAREIPNLKLQLHKSGPHSFNNIHVVQVKSYFLTDNGPLIVGQFFSNLCCSSGLKKPPTTVDEPHLMAG